MSSYKAWKAFERRHAKRMGGERLWRPDYGDSAPDGESATATWDCKAYQRHAAVTMHDDCRRKYVEFTGDERHFHLALYAVTQKAAGDFVVIEADHYASLLGLS